MSGIQFVTNDKGEKVAVQIDLRKHGDLWEDIGDVLMARARRGEKSVSVADYITRRRKRGKSHA